MPAHAAADSSAPTISIAVNERFLNNARSSIGPALRRSATTNAAIATAVTASSVIVIVDAQSPRMSA